MAPLVACMAVSQKESHASCSVQHKSQTMQILELSPLVACILHASLKLSMAGGRGSARKGCQLHGGAGDPGRIPANKGLQFIGFGAVLDVVLLLSLLPLKHEVRFVLSLKAGWPVGPPTSQFPMLVRSNCHVESK